MNKSLYFIYMFNNYFCLTYIDLNESTKINKLVINKHRNDIDKIYNFLSKNQIKIGYKNNMYESKISSYILNVYNEILCIDSNEDVCNKIFSYSCSITDKDDILFPNEVDLNKIYLSTKSLNSISNRIFIPSYSSKIYDKIDLDESKWDDFSEFCTRMILEIRLFYLKVFNDKIIESEKIKIDLNIKKEELNNQVSLF